MSEPLVTLVIPPRESHFLSKRSLLSVLADDSAPFELIYVDIASPPDVAQAIQAQAAARNFKVIRHDQWVAPAAARKQALAEVRTKYAACIDNDVLVEPGCRAGRGGEQPRPRTGRLHRVPLCPRPDGDDVLLIHEQLDLALVARQQGLAVMVEPAARATYVAFEPRALRDLAFYRRRWGKAECAQSVYAFADKWLGCQPARAGRPDAGLYRLAPAGGRAAPARLRGRRPGPADDPGRAGPEPRRAARTGPGAGLFGARVAPD